MPLWAVLGGADLPVRLQPAAIVFREFPWEASLRRAQGRMPSLPRNFAGGHKGVPAAKGGVGAPPTLRPESCEVLARPPLALLCSLAIGSGRGGNFGLTTLTLVSDLVGLKFPDLDNPPPVVAPDDHNSQVFDPEANVPTRKGSR